MLYLKEEELKILDLLLIYFSQINARPFNELIAVLILNLSILQRKFPFRKNTFFYKQFKEVLQNLMFM